MSDPVVKTDTGHVIGALYESRYWGGVYRVIGPGKYLNRQATRVDDVGVEVECVVPGAGAHQTVGERWSHMTSLEGGWRADQIVSAPKFAIGDRVREIPHAFVGTVRGISARNAIYTYRVQYLNCDVVLRDESDLAPAL